MMCKRLVKRSGAQTLPLSQDKHQNSSSWFTARSDPDCWLVFDSLAWAMAAVCWPRIGSADLPGPYGVSMRSRPSSCRNSGGSRQLFEVSANIGAIWRGLYPASPQPMGVTWNVNSGCSLA